MKKVFLTTFAALAMVAMVACNNNAQPAEQADTAATEQCDKPCEKKCDKPCDSTKCCEQKVEGMACDKAEGEKCCKEGEAKECHKADGEKKCCKAEGKECPKAN